MTEGGAILSPRHLNGATKTAGICRQGEAATCDLLLHSRSIGGLNNTGGGAILSPQIFRSAQPTTHAFLAYICIGIVSGEAGFMNGMTLGIDSQY